MKLIAQYNMKQCLPFICIFLALMSINTHVKAEICGKIDAGPTFAHIDVLESGHTVKKINMAAIKADIPTVIWKGICIRPGILYGRHGHAHLLSASFGIGHYTPITDQFSITPSVGVLFTELKTTIRLPFIPCAVHLRERFHSLAPYLCLEAVYCFMPGWRVVGSYQYAWSRTRTLIKHLGDFKSHSDGPNYSMMIEHDLNKNWSINLGGAYNISLSKEKHGLRGYGFRLGFAYWF